MGIFKSKKYDSASKKYFFFKVTLPLLFLFGIFALIGIIIACSINVIEDQEAMAFVFFFGMAVIIAAIIAFSIYANYGSVVAESFTRIYIVDNNRQLSMIDIVDGSKGNITYTGNVGAIIELIKSLRSSSKIASTLKKLQGEPSVIAALSRGEFPYVGPVPIRKVLKIRKSMFGYNIKAEVLYSNSVRKINIKLSEDYEDFDTLLSYLNQLAH